MNHRKRMFIVGNEHTSDKLITKAGYINCLTAFERITWTMKADFVYSVWDKTCLIFNFFNHTMDVCKRILSFEQCFISNKTITCFFICFVFFTSRTQEDTHGYLLVQTTYRTKTCSGLNSHKVVLPCPCPRQDHWEHHLDRGSLHHSTRHGESEPENHLPITDYKNNSNQWFYVNQPDTRQGFWPHCI